MTDVRICQQCGRELPIEKFRQTRGGGRTNACIECIERKRANTRANVSAPRIASNYSDPDFDGKTLREVMNMMSRAKRWLESRGCIINLSGEFHETIIKKLKFE